MSARTKVIEQALRDPWAEPMAIDLFDKLAAVLEAAWKLRDVALDYCENARPTDRPTKDICEALDRYDRAAKKLGIDP